MRFRNRQLPSPAFPFVYPLTQIPSELFDNDCDSDAGSGAGNCAMVTLNDRSHGTYLGDMYFPAPFLFGEADYKSD